MSFCKNCSFNATKPAKMTKLATRSSQKLVVVAGKPRAYECNKNTPLSGPGGQVLRDTLKKVGISIAPEDTYLTPAIKCAVPSKKQLNASACASCSAILQEELNYVKPNLVLICGKDAAQVFFNNKDVKVTKYQGVVGDAKTRDGHEYKYLVTLNPALILRQPGDYKTLIEHFQYAKKLLYAEEMYDCGNTEFDILYTKEEMLKLCTDESILKMKAQSYKGRFGCDMETTGLKKTDKELTIGFAYAKNKAVCFFGEALKQVNIFFDACRKHDVKLVWHNGEGFDIHILNWKEMGGANKCILDDDTKILHYVFNEQPPHDLGHLSKLYLYADEYKSKMNSVFKEGTAASAADKDLAERVCVDADYTYQLYVKMESDLHKEGNEKLCGLYHDHLIPAAQFFHKVSDNGLLVNPLHLDKLDMAYQEELKHRIEELQEIAAPIWNPIKYKKVTGAKTAPEKFNPGSPKQMSYLVHDVLQCKCAVKKGKSTDAKVLESIENPPPLVLKVLEYRSVKKEHGTYVQGILNKIDPKDGRVHSKFSVSTAATGRTTSREPNVQNLPATNGVGNIRKAIIAAPGKLLMEVDYSGAELRVLAHVGHCKDLNRIFLEGIDMHDTTATGIYGPNFTKAQRMAAKTVTFGELC